MHTVWSCSVTESILFVEEGDDDMSISLRGSKLGGGLVKEFSRVDKPLQRK